MTSNELNNYTPRPEAQRENPDFTAALEDLQMLWLTDTRLSKYRAPIHPTS